MTKKSKATRATKPAQTTLTAVERWQDADDLRWAARHWAVRIGVKTPRIQVRPMTTKWASISTAGRLTLNTDLLDVPKNLGEFVVVHELVHLLVPNHGPVFKSFLHAYLPDWRQREQELRWHNYTLAGKGQGTRVPDQGPRVQRKNVTSATGVRAHDRPSHGAHTRVQAQAETIITTAAMPSVLVVDDEPAQRRLLREILTLEGRAVHVARHGGIALRRLRASTQSMVVLLGLMMPEVDGEAVLEALAADETLASRHAFVMMTAATPRANEGRVAELRRQLGIPLISKPFSVSDILDAVEKAARQLVTDATP
ncbi:MAG: YgjP-like metallopeptidase domain-containing protein [Ktedonobacterales bacterium]